MTKHRASVYVSYELLKQALGIRDDVKLFMVMSNDYDKLGEVVHLVFEHPSLPEQPEAGYPLVGELEDVTG